MGTPTTKAALALEPQTSCLGGRDLSSRKGAIMFDKFDHEAELTMGRANVESDFRLALTLFPTAGLTRLAEAMSADQVISGLYKLGPKRCLFGWLAGWGSRQECLQHDYPSKQHFLAVRRTIRSFDRGLLTPAVIGRILAEVIRDRQELNRQEEETRRAALRRLDSQLV
jgi:hypothetical protein